MHARQMHTLVRWVGSSGILAARGLIILPARRRAGHAVAEAAARVAGVSAGTAVQVGIPFGAPIDLFSLHTGGVTSSMSRPPFERLKIKALTDVRLTRA